LGSIKRKFTDFVAQDELITKKAKNTEDAHKLASEFVQAARAGNASLMQSLIQRGANVNVRVCGCTALQYASFYGNLPMVHSLLSLGADVNAQNYSGITALMWAVERSHRSVAKTLLAGGSRCDLKDANGTTALLKAVTRGSVEMVKLLLEDGDCDADMNNGKPGESFTAFHEACALGKADVAMLLLEYGADLEKSDHKKRTALHRAVCSNQPAVIRSLVECGANVNAQDETERTPAHWAAFFGYKDCMLALISSGRVDFLMRDCSKKTPLDVANIRRHHEMAEVIKTRGTC